jgi:hypothetical protein
MTPFSTVMFQASSVSLRMPRLASNQATASS